MGMSRYYRNIFGVPKDGTPPTPPEAVTVTEIPDVAEMTFVTEEPVVEAPAPNPVKKIGGKKKK